MDESCQALAVASDRNDVGEAAQRKIEDFDQVLERYCLQTLDAGAGAAVVAGWMAEVQGERLRTEEELAAARSTSTG